MSAIQQQNFTTPTYYCTHVIAKIINDKCEGCPAKNCTYDHNVDPDLIHDLNIKFVLEKFNNGRFERNQPKLGSWKYDNITDHPNASKMIRSILAREQALMEKQMA